MKKFVIIFGALLISGINAKAEIYRYIDVDEIYKIGNFSSKEEVKKLIDSYAQSDVPNDSQKTTVSNVIDNYYLHPEYTPIIKTKCQESMPWIKGSFGLWEEPNFRADMCLTWETNKKLNKEQIELLAHLKKAWKNVIGDLHQENDAGAFYDRIMEYSLQLAVRFYNLVLRQNWPECLFETGKNLDYFQYDKKPCNVESTALGECKETKDAKVCMKDKLTIAIQTLVDVNNKNIAHKDINKLLHLTQKTIEKIEPNKDKQNSEIIRLYNFYWLSIHDAYDVISLFAKTSVE